MPGQGLIFGQIPLGQMSWDIDPAKMSIFDQPEAGEKIQIVTDPPTHNYDPSYIDLYIFWNRL